MVDAGGGEVAAADAAGWCGGCARLGWSLPLRERVHGRRGCETTGWGQRERIRVGKKFPLAHYSSLSTARSFSCFYL